jgi:hypothetical protein
MVSKTQSYYRTDRKRPFAERVVREVLSPLDFGSQSKRTWRMIGKRLQIMFRQPRTQLIAAFLAGNVALFTVDFLIGGYVQGRLFSITPTSATGAVERPAVFVADKTEASRSWR